MKKFKYIGFIVLSIIIFSGCYIYYLSVQRDTKTWVENTQVTSNLNIPIELMTSQKKYYGGHAAGWGGGDVKNHIKFRYNDIEYMHESSYIPIVIKCYKNDFYLIYFDRETHLRKRTFRFYKSNKGVFKEIKATDFPKHLAVQNRWFNEYNNIEKDLEGLNPQKLIATMTVDIWYMIEGKQSIFTRNTIVPIEFIEKYKKENFTDLAITL